MQPTSPRTVRVLEMEAVNREACDFPYLVWRYQQHGVAGDESDHQRDCEDGDQPVPAGRILTLPHPIFWFCAHADLACNTLLLSADPEFFFGARCEPISAFRSALARSSNFAN